MIDQRILQRLPDTPGVYLMKDATGTILYIGKAVSLASRVRSYFQHGAMHTAKTARMIEQVDDIEWILTGSNLEALLLESNLVKHHQPKFNVVLRDDKQYPYLRLPINDPFPRLSVVRRVADDGALYYGPYVPAGALRGTLKTIRKVFPLATCEIDIDGKAPRACIEFEIQRCMAPCIGNQTSREYHEIVKHVRMFLEGRDTELSRVLHKQMEAAAERQDFEEAVRKRDRLFMVKRVLEKQRITQIGCVEQDVVGLARDGGSVLVQMFFVRGGLLIGRKEFFLTRTDALSDEDCLRSVVEQLYAGDLRPAKEIVVPCSMDGQDVIAEWLSERKGETVRIITPKRGMKRKILDMAHENATIRLRERFRPSGGSQDAVAAIQALLQLDTRPERIVGIDISNIQESNPVGSLVVFQDGEPKKSEYRKFKIKTVQGPNDFGMIREVVLRYGIRMRDTRSVRPDLIIIDGGKGQLSSALEALAECGLSDIDVIGLAKERGENFERVFLPDCPEPILLNAHSSGTHLFQRIRDEAHRFAVTYHRTLRSKALRDSALDRITGIGAARKQALLKWMGSVDRIRGATEEELQRVPGITPRIASVIKSTLGHLRTKQRERSRLSPGLRPPSPIGRG